MPLDHEYFVYILSSRSRTLYIGVTNSLLRRVREHREGTANNFTTKYKIQRLVYFERFKHINNAIAREKYLKHFTRQEKIALIESTNPTWEDLASEVFALPLGQTHKLKPLSSFRNAGGPAFVVVSVFKVVILRRRRRTCFCILEGRPMKRHPPNPRLFGCSTSRGSGLPVLASLETHSTCSNSLPRTCNAFDFSLDANNLTSEFTRERHNPTAIRLGLK